MAEYIERNAIYEKISELEELARSRVVDTPSISPAYARYVSQLNERTALKHMIFDTPAADAAKVVHGYWILKHIGAGHTWECSCCHKQPCIYITKDTNYCPNCGAKMDMEQE